MTCLQIIGLATFVVYVLALAFAVWATRDKGETGATTAAAPITHKRTTKD